MSGGVGQHGEKCKTRSQLAEETMARHALSACRLAECAHDSGRRFSINALPDDLRRAAHALLHAAIAHCLVAHGRPLPKTINWQGRVWHLSPADKGRLQVSPYPDTVGIYSMPGALI